MAAVPIGTSKARLLATLDGIRLAIEALPEPACKVLEDARVLHGFKLHLGQMGEVVDVMRPLGDAVRVIGRAVSTVKKSRARRH